MLTNDVAVPRIVTNLRSTDIMLDTDRWDPDFFYAISVTKISKINGRSV